MGCLIHPAYSMDKPVQEMGSGNNPAFHTYWYICQNVCWYCPNVCWYCSNVCWYSRKCLLILSKRVLIFFQCLLILFKCLLILSKCLLIFSKCLLILSLYWFILCSNVCLLKGEYEDYKWWNGHNPLDYHPLPWVQFSISSVDPIFNNLENNPRQIPYFSYFTVWKINL